MAAPDTSDRPCECVRFPRAPVVNTVPIAPVSVADTLATVERMLRCARTHIINHVPADVTVHARKNPLMRSALEQADLNVPDGMGVVWACRALGFPDVRERVYGPTFMELLSRWGLTRDLTHFLLGGSPEVLAALQARLSAAHPGIALAGYSPPFRAFDNSDLEEMALHINRSGAQVVWVGLGTPKQQTAAAALGSMVDARVILTVGAAFDFLSGSKRQAPVWIQDHGLEWAFRLATEPRRLARRYLLGNPQFVAGVLADRLGARKASRTE